MSTTLLPFLYQTRTLQRLARACPTRQALRLLHATPRLQERRSFRNSPKYKAKTQKGADPIPFILPEEMVEKPDPNAVDQPRMDTITPAERLAFERAFEEIAARRPPTQAMTSWDTDAQSFVEDQPVGVVEDEEPGEHESVPISFPWGTPEPTSTERGPNPAHMNVNIIIDDAAKRYKKQPPIRGLPSLSPLQTLKGSKDPAMALMRYPPSLRDVARVSLGIYDGQEAEDPKSVKALLRKANAAKNEAAEDKSVLATFGVNVHLKTKEDLEKTLENERLRRVEHERIVAKMIACKNDVDLWKVMETEVFYMLTRLGIGKTTGKKNKGTKVESATKAELDMYIYGPVYPMLLLSSIRLLDRHFSQPSQLALSVLPRIKELGTPSYVLGVSTTFYNCLLDIYWQRYGDVGSVLAHLEEMRHAGLYFDNNTANTLNRITMWLSEMANGGHGAFLQAAMSMPEYEVALRSRLKHWSKEIARSMFQRKDDLGY